MENSTTGERLQTYFSEKGLSMAQVSRETNIQYDTLLQILHGRVKAMGVDKFTAIWQAYPDINAWHVLTGEDVNERKVENLKTVGELRSFKEKIDRVIEQRIAELEN